MCIELPPLFLSPLGGQQHLEHVGVISSNFNRMERVINLKYFPSKVHPWRPVFLGIPGMEYGLFTSRPLDSAKVSRDPECLPSDECSENCEVY